MSPTPFWKIWRELSRAFGQLMASPLAGLQYLFATPYHDLILSRRRRITPGRMALGARVAVYLIFPRRGLLPSHLAALRYLAENGYAALVVSNAPLTGADRATLTGHAALLIERVNFGYDFGGYREAMLWLAPRLTGLQRLVLLNDSSWFPLPGARNWLAEAEALGVDYSAATWSGAVDRPPPWEYETITWQIDKGRRNFHYASYALGFSARLLADPGFLAFWRGFRLAQAKNRTVRRGEIGLTKWVLGKGYSHGATVELADLGVRVAALSRPDLDRLFERLVILDDPEMEAIRTRIRAAGGDAPRAQLEKLILAVTARRGAVYALADLLVRDYGFAFLKKSPAAQGKPSAPMIRQLLADLDGPLRDDILGEIGPG